MQWQHGNGTFKQRNAARSANSLSNHLVRDVKYLAMTACQSKANACITSICTASSSGPKKALPKIVPSAGKNG